jgi:hypothetical protein
VRAYDVHTTRLSKFDTARASRAKSDSAIASGTPILV